MKVENEFQAILCKDKEPLFSNHFVFSIDFTIPEMTIFGFKISKIQLFGAKVDCLMEIRNWTKFKLNVKFELCVLNCKI